MTINSFDSFTHSHTQQNVHFSVLDLMDIQLVCEKKILYFYMKIKFLYEAYSYNCKRNDN